MGRLDLGCIPPGIGWPGPGPGRGDRCSAGVAGECNRVSGTGSKAEFIMRGEIRWMDISRGRSGGSTPSRQLVPQRWNRVIVTRWFDPEMRRAGFPSRRNRPLLAGHPAHQRQPIQRLPLTYLRNTGSFGFPRDSRYANRSRTSDSFKGLSRSAGISEVADRCCSST